MGTVLEHPTGLFQGRLICHGPYGLHPLTAPQGILTGGQGRYSMELSHYDPVPGNLQQQIANAHKKEHAAAG